MADNIKPKVQPSEADIAFGTQMQEIFERLRHLEACVSRHHPHGYVPAKKLHRMQEDLLDFRKQFSQSAVLRPDVRTPEAAAALRGAFYPAPGGKRDPYGDLVEPRDPDDQGGCYVALRSPQGGEHL